MKLYYMPGACSIGIHVLLEEIGKPYDLQKIDGAKQEQYGPDFVKLNPKSKVPTLQKDDGSVLTEFPAIATWLARKNPDKNLLPSDADGEAQRARGDGLRRLDHAHAGLQPHVPPGRLRADRGRPRHGQGARQGDHGEGPGPHGQGARGQGVRRRQVLGRRCRAVLRHLLGGRPHEDAAAQERRGALRADEEPSGGQAHARAGRAGPAAA